MRLRSLRLEHYGNFECCELALDPAPGRINIIEAPNGAGKSVLRQAFHDLLFGIDAKLSPHFRYLKERPNLVADARFADGEQLVFGSRLKEGRVLLGGDAAAEARLSGMVKRITPRQLEHLFAIDTARLRQGGQELASGGDTLGLALLAGTGELTFAKAVRTSLAAKRDGLWMEGKTATPLNKANRAVEQARKQLTKSVRQPRQRIAQVQQQEAHRAALAQARESHLAAQQTVRRLARIERTRAPLQELAAAQAWLSANPDAPLLPAATAEDLARARGELARQTDRRAEAEQHRDTSRQTAAEVMRDPVASAHDEALGRLAEAFGGAYQAFVDCPGVKREQAGVIGAMAAVLRELEADSPLASAASLLPPLALVTATRELIKRHAAIQAELDSAAKQQRQALADLATVEAEAASAGPGERASLRALLKEIRDEGNPGRNAAAAASAVRAAAAEAEAALAHTPGWRGTAADLRAMAPPSQATLERLAEEVARTRAASQRAVSERAKLGSERDGWRSGLAELQATVLPDEAAIAQSRSARDTGWRLIYRRAFTAQPPDVAAEAAYAEGEALPLRFQRHLREADALADRRLLELPRVNEAGRLARELARTEESWATLEMATHTAAAEASSAEERWAAACQSCGAAASSTIGELRSLLSARSDAIEADRRLTLALGDQAALAKRHAAWADRLRAELAASAGQELPALLATADLRLEADRAAELAGVARQTRRAELINAQRKADADRLAAVAKLQEWQTEWSAVLDRLGRPAGEPPAVVEPVLQRLSDLGALIDQAAEFAKRIVGMEAVIGRFSDEVAELAGNLGIPAEPDPFATARRLTLRRTAARAQEAAWGTADLARANAEEAAGRTEAAEREARQNLDAIVAACGGSDAEDAHRRLTAARERLHYEMMRERAVAALSAYGDGFNHDELNAQAAALPAERMAEERDAAETVQRDALDRSEAARLALHEAERDLSQAAAAEDAIDAVAAQSAAATDQARLLDDYLLFAVAGDMLARALKEVEQSAGGDGVRRISKAFATLTGDAYTIAGVPGKSGETVLQAVEAAFPEEWAWKTISQLSEGTRDQLYLALRLVAIEDHVVAAPALPFIADDILQTFDDARARSALAALVDLSQHVQVIVLTHHPHVLALAEGLPMHVQRL